MSLLSANPVYKPFHYPWAYDAWLQQQRIHWLPEEVPLADDVKDWQKTLTDKERNLLTQIFRFFVQADVEVNNCYMGHYSRVFKPTEVCMMLSSFSNTEVTQPYLIFNSSALFVEVFKACAKSFVTWSPPRETDDVYSIDPLL